MRKIFRSLRQMFCKHEPSRYVVLGDFSGDLICKKCWKVYKEGK